MTMTPAPISVERLRELLDKATQGPWLCCDGPTGYQHRIYSDSAPEGICDAADTSDTRLIVAAVNALPALLHQLAEREAEVERWQRVYAGICVELVRAGIPAFGTADEAIHKLRDKLLAAERAREGACRMLREIHDSMQLNEKANATIAAFLAASGGKVDG